jgi:hypothetical protein
LDPLHRAYFNSYALWAYITTPFLLMRPEFEVTEIATRRECEETWRGLRAKFPPDVASPARSRISSNENYSKV